MNFKKRTLRCTNNFINLSFLGINLALSLLCVFNIKYAEFSDLALLLGINLFGLLPIYYFQKQFSNKGKYINILPLSMKKIYLITLIDWFIAYVITAFITLLIFSKINFGYKTYFYTPGIMVAFNGVLAILRINFLIISVMIVIKFYKGNCLLILGGFIVIYETINILGSFCLEKIKIFGVLIDFRYLMLDIGISILSIVLFFVMSTKLDKLSIE